MSCRAANGAPAQLFGHPLNQAEIDRMTEDRALAMIKQRRQPGHSYDNR
jgi:hypothetical protein